VSPSARASVPLADRLAGGVWGHLVGDAVGVPYEFKPESPADSVVFGAHGTHGQPPGTWSDDGALMLSLLDSLLSVGFDTTDQAACALAWADRGQYTPDGDGKFDIGIACGHALDRLRNGTPAEEAGGPGEHDNGNGSLMRILPVALVGRDEPDSQLIEQAHRASSGTHGHPRSLVCCALYVLIAARLLRGEGRRPSLAAARRSVRRDYAGRADGAPLLAALDFVETYPDRGGRGRVWDSFWSAWDAFAGAPDYQATIQRAVAYGDDTDTTAAIAGGLAGIYWGLSGIPAVWIAAMRGHAAADPLVTRLTAGAKVHR